MGKITDVYVTMECQLDADTLYQEAERLKVDIDEMSEEELAGFAHDCLWRASGRLVVDLWGVDITGVEHQGDSE